MDLSTLNRRITLAAPIALLLLVTSVGLIQAAEERFDKGNRFSKLLADNTKAKTNTSEAKSKPKQEAQMAEIYKFNANALDGKEVKFDGYKGDVLLIVNTASKCGYTPQFTGLEELNKKFAARGLKVLGFPCNQFGQQEPGNSEEIGSFCQRNYGVDFQMFEKIDVNGENAHPLFKYLTGTDGNAKPIKWNFTKFLVDRKGDVVGRFESDVKPEDMVGAIEKQL